VIRLLLLLGLVTFSPAFAGEKEQAAGPLWQTVTTLERAPGKDGKPRDPSKISLWLPKPGKPVRGLVLVHDIVIGAKLALDPDFRAAAAGEKLGIVFFEKFDGLFETSKGAGTALTTALEDLAQQTSQPEIARVPWFTIGHSTAGIFARNIAYWKPDRVIGILHIKSGNMHQHRPNPEATLAGVPFLAINGQFEEFGPEGGIRPEYGRETQWILMGRSLLDLRARDPRNLFSLAVHPSGNHTNWSPEMTRLGILFLQAACAARLPSGSSSGSDSVVVCREVSVESGWLTDPDLRNPAHHPASWDSYTGDKARAYWHLNRDLAETITALHTRLAPPPASPTPSSTP
jgi:hypothetical protein